LTVLKRLPASSGENTIEETLFGRIADDIERQGYSIRPGALPREISDSLLAYQQGLNSGKYMEAGIGRGENFLKNEFVRTDKICWITGASDAGRLWIEWTSCLQSFLNRRLFLGLFSFESHFAHYAPGDYYKRHYDAFKGEANRVLSVVTYLNPGWTMTDGGELVLYRDDLDQDGIRIVPLLGTVVVFLSEDFPHEVLAANRDRYSVAGWFRINASTAGKVDPPQ
jgi:SM-20-related protein